MKIRAGGGNFRAGGGSFRVAGCSPLLFLFMGNTMVREQVGDGWADTVNDGQQIGMDRQMLYKLGSK